MGNEELKSKLKKYRDEIIILNQEIKQKKARITYLEKERENNLNKFMEV